MRLSNLKNPNDVVSWANETVRLLETYLSDIDRTKQTKGSANRLSVHVKTDLPPASQPGQLIHVSDETGGAVVAFSDGTNWRRMTDRSVVA